MAKNKKTASVEKPIDTAPKQDLEVTKLNEKITSLESQLFENEKFLRASEEKVETLSNELESTKQSLQISEEKTEALTTELTKVKALNEGLSKQLEIPEKEEKVETKEDYENNRETFKLEDGRVFAFKFGTPKKLRINGAVKTQDELLKNKQAMHDLIFGNAYFVEQVK